MTPFSRWLACSLFLALSPLAQAADFYWIPPSSGAWSNSGNWASSSGGAGGAGAPGTADQAIFDAAGPGNCLIDQAVSVSTLTISTSTGAGWNGYIDTSSNTITVSSFTQNYGTFYARTSSITVSGAGWAAGGGTFDAGSSSVVFTGAAPGLSGSTTFYSFAYAVAGGTITLPANSTQTVTGTLSLQGVSGNRVFVRSATSGTYAYLINTGTNTVSFVDAKDNNASGGFTILAGTNSVNSGHNANWTFAFAASPIEVNGLNGELTYGGVAWGDYDNDGRLDLAVSGSTSTSGNYPQIWVFHNDGGGAFSKVDVAGVNGGLTNGSIAWGDINNDGLLDIVSSGKDFSGYESLWVYRNNGGSFAKVDVAGVNGGLRDSGALSLGDYDNDGFLDIAIGGLDPGSSRHLWIFRNNQGAGFTKEVDVAGPNKGLANNGVAWGDYNNDGRLDLAVSGKEAGTNYKHLWVYRNDGSTFTKVYVAASNSGLDQGAIAWGDYNNDGRLDLAINGWDNSGNNRLWVHRNDGGDVFVQVDVAGGAKGLRNGTVAWGDYDNDGFLDIAVSGNDSSGNYQIRVYRNNSGDGTFLKVNVTGPIDGLNDGSVAWGDYDQDGALDIAVNGDDSNGVPHIRVYRNMYASLGVANTAPSAPAALSSAFAFSSTDVSTAAFKWNPASDNGGGATGADTLTYDLVVSTVSNFATTIIPGLSSATPLMGNYLRPPKIYDGNANHGVFLVSTQPWVHTSPYGLQTDNTYYYKVRTIDAGLLPSGWSSALTLNTGVAPSAITNLYASTGTSGGVINLAWTAPGNDQNKAALNPGTFRVFYSSVSSDVAGLLVSSPATSSLNRVDIATSSVNPGDAQAYALSGLDAGTTYYIRLFTADQVPNWSDMSNGATTWAQLNAHAWTGAASADWFTAGNWDPPAVPSAADLATLVPASNQPVLTADVTVSSLTLVAGSTLTLSGYGLTLSSFTNAGNLILKGTETVTTAPYNLAGSTVTYNAGSGTIPILSTWTYRNLAVNGAGGTFNPSGSYLDINEGFTLGAGTLNLNGSSVTVGGDWDVRGGTFNAGVSSVTFAGSGAQNVYSSSRTYFAIAVANAAGVTFMDSLTVSTFSMTMANALAKLPVSPSSVTVTGYLNLNGQATGTRAQLQSAVSGTRALLVLASGLTQNVKNASVKDSDASAGVAGNAADASNLDSGNNLNWSFPETGVRYWVKGSGAGNWSDAANWSWSSGGSGGAGAPAGSLSAIFDGNGPGSCLMDQAVSVSTLTISTSAGAGWNGYIDTSSNTITVSSFTMNYGTFYARTSSITVSGSGWAAGGGTFDAGSSSVAFTGSAPGLSGSTTFYSFAYAVAGGTITLPANSTQTVTGTLSLQGVSGNRVFVRSATSGTYSYLINTGTNTVSFVDAKDSNASGGFTILAGTNSVNSGHNANWTFAFASTPIEVNGLNGGLSYGGIGWGDYNNDGLLDIVVSGTGQQILVFRNDGGGSFTKIDVAGGNGGLYVGSVAWGDYNNDGLLDIAASGIDASLSNEQIWVFRNNGGDSFTKVDVAGVNGGLNGGDVAWGDYDNDGLLDIAASGLDGSNNEQLWVFRNDGGGSFTKVDVGGPNGGLVDGTVAWGDYNNDGFLDIAANGWNDGGSRSIWVFRNDGGGSFTKVDVAGVNGGLWKGAVVWGDYNNDGLLDIAANGWDAGGGRRVWVFRNDGGGSFTKVDVAGSGGLFYGSVALGDYDNDGFLDFAVSGGNVGSQLLVFRNNNGSSFTKVDVAGGNDGLSYGKVAFGDYDKDKAVDLVVSGLDAGSQPQLRVYRNMYASLGVANTAPSAPAALSSAFAFSAASVSTATFKWNPASDNGGGATGANTLTYDLVVSTVSNFATTLVPGLSSATPLMGNYLRPPKIYDGNANHGVFLVSTQPWVHTSPYGLQTDNTYYYKVRTIDAGLLPSGWSSALTLNTGVAPSAITNLYASTGTSGGVIELAWTAPGNDQNQAALNPGTFRVFYSSVSSDVAGLLVSSPATSSLNRVDIATSSVNPGDAQAYALSGLDAGTTYYIRLFTADQVPNWSDMSNGATTWAQLNAHAWTGAASADWFTAGNWDPPAVPAAADLATIVPASNQPVLTANVTVSSLTLVAGSTLTLNGYGLALSSFTNAGNLILRGTETVTAAPDNLAGSTVTYNAGSGTVPILSTWTYRNLVFNAPTSTGTLTAALNVTESLFISSGVFDTSNADNWSVAVGSSLYMSGGIFRARNSNITVGANWDSSAGIFNCGNSTVNLTGNGTLKFVSSFSVFRNLGVAASGKTTTLKTNSLWVNMLTTGSGVLTGNSYGVYLTGGGDVFIDGGATLVLGELRYRIGNSTQNVVGRDYTGVGTLYFYGIGGVNYRNTYSMQGDLVANAVQIYSNNQSAGQNAPSILNTNGYSVTATDLKIGVSGSPQLYGRLNAGSSTITINGNVTVYPSTSTGLNVLNASSSAWTVSGNWVSSDTFNAGTSTVAFVSASAQTVNTYGQGFATVIASNTSSGGLTFQSSFSATNFTASALPAASTITFAANSTATITNLTLQGSSGKPVAIRSSAPGTYAYLNNTGANAVTFVDVQDNNASPGVAINADDGTSVNSGHNKNWNFGGTARYWVKTAGTGAWSDSDNWATASGAAGGAGAPTASQQAIFDAGGPGNCLIDQAVSVSTLTISTSTGAGWNGYIDTSSNTITVSSFTMNYGTFYARTSSITVNGSVTISSGAFYGNGATITVSGDWDSSGLTRDWKGTSTVNLTGTGIVKQNSWYYGFNNLSLAATGKTTTITSSIYVKKLTTGSGALTDGSQSFLVEFYEGSGDVFVDGGATLTFSQLMYKASGVTQNVVGRDYTGIGTLVFYGYGGVGGANTLSMQGNVVANQIQIFAQNSGSDNRRSILNTNDYGITATGLIIGRNGYPQQYGRLDAGSSTITINGNFTVYPSTSTGLNVINASSSAWTVSGNWVSSDTFNAGTSTVAFVSASAQTVNTYGQGFATVIASNTSSGGLTFQSSFSATNFTASGLSAASTIYFNANSTATITNLTLQGSSGKRIAIRSSTPGTYAYLNNIGANAVTFVDVQDNNATAGQTINANDGTSVNSGHNKNWNFGGTARYWVKAAGTGNWSDSDNWGLASGAAGGAGAPSASQEAIFDAGGPGNCLIDQAVSVSTLTISTAAGAGWNGYIDTSSNTITVSSFTQNYGTFYARTSSITVNGGLTVSSGTFNANASSLTVGGAFSAAPGTFAGTGTVYFPGGSTIDANGQNLGDVIIGP